MKQLLLQASYLLSLIYSQAIVFDYKKKGNDWPLLKIPENNCGGPGQAPIDLSRSMTKVSIVEDK
jgi:hypothetical protein